MFCKRINRRGALVALVTILPGAVLTARHGVDSYLVGGIVAGMLVGGLLCFSRARAPEAA
jgi:hypothetical protein